MKTIELIRAYAMSFIAAMFIGYGITYFQPRDEYRVPRILIPVLNTFGNVGLAIGMILLGAILIYLAYRNLQKVSANVVIFFIFIAAVAGGTFALIHSTENKKKPSIESLKEKINAGNTSTSKGVTAGDNT